MLRKPFKPTRLAVVVQVASLLLIASGVFGILAGDIIRHRAEGAGKRIQLFLANEAWSSLAPSHATQ